MSGLDWPLVVGTAFAMILAGWKFGSIVVDILHSSKNAHWVRLQKIAAGLWCAIALTMLAACLAIHLAAPAAVVSGFIGVNAISLFGYVFVENASRRYHDEAQ